MKITASRKKSIMRASIVAAMVAAFLVVFFYPVWVVAIGGHLGLEVPGVTRIWKADFSKTVSLFLYAEIGVAFLVGACVYGMSQELSKPREVGI